jgi:FkbM family methyltransferase
VSSNPPIQPRDLSQYLATETRPERELQRMWPANANLTIFDIGACEGEDSIRYARRFARARIFTFEPLPTNQEIVRTNFNKYGITNAELHPLALSDRIGTADFHVSAGEPPVKFAGSEWNYGNKSSSLLAPAGDAPMHGWIRFPETITVNCATLDSFCSGHDLRRIDFIHMDVQGAEWLVLQGATRILPHVGAIWLEVAETPLYADQKLRGEIEALMRQRGFALIHEERRGTEGDQFYVNGRTWRGRRRILRAAVEKGYRYLRRQFGALRRHLRRST